MKKIITCCLVFFTTWAIAGSNENLYQVDMIVFAQNDLPQKMSEHALSSLIISDMPKAIQLAPYSGQSKPYELLPLSQSQLSNELWALKNKGPYKVLAQFTWLQPENNRQPVLLPTINQDGWNMEGTLRIRHTNYFQLDTELLFSTPRRESHPFVFSQKHRLEQDKVYYLDHPEAGILIKIHPIA